MISEGSCDTEDWSNDCWKCSILGIHYIVIYVTMDYKTSNKGQFFEIEIYTS